MRQVWAHTCHAQVFTEAESILYTDTGMFLNIPKDNFVQIKFQVECHATLIMILGPLYCLCISNGDWQWPNYSLKIRLLGHTFSSFF
jgi:hypothetical protein